MRRTWHRYAQPQRVLSALGLVAACSAGRPSASVAHHPPPPADLEAETSCGVEHGGWPRAARGTGGLARVEDGRLVQTLHDGSTRELAFVGAHAFDLLGKLASEAESDAERRRIVCHVLDDAARRGVKALRIWGSLKRTGTDREVAESARLLALVLDENARRAHPLRFVVTLLNHQAGYGAPDPSRSLDDQDPGPWHARELYLRDGWRASGVGSLAHRIEVFAAERALASRYVVAWELVNELDTFRHIAGGSFAGDDAEALREAFVVPAATKLAVSLPQPIMLGDIRGDRDAYARWAPALLDALPAPVRARLLWTSHVYVERGADPAGFLHKLDVDLAIAERHGLPFVLGELGQRVPGAPTAFCERGPRHDLRPVVEEIARRGVRSLFVWGEGRCALDVGHGRTMIIGAGADSAELTSEDEPFLRSLRRRW